MVFMSYPFYKYLAISSHQLSEDPGAHATQKRPGPRFARDGPKWLRRVSAVSGSIESGRLRNRGFNRGFQMSLTRAKWELMLVGVFFYHLEKYESQLGRII
jgi:hypothetical protein